MTATKQLHKAVQERRSPAVQQLLVAGADANAKDGLGWTPLHWAAEIGDAELVALLLSHGAAPDTRDATDATALHRAAGGGRTEVCRQLLAAGADITSKNSLGWTPLQVAVADNHPDTASFLQANTRTLDIFSAAAVGCIERLKALVDGNAKLATMKDEYGPGTLALGRHWWPCGSGGTAVESWRTLSMSSPLPAPRRCILPRNAITVPSPKFSFNTGPT